MQIYSEILTRSLDNYFFRNGCQAARSEISLLFQSSFYAKIQKSTSKWHTLYAVNMTMHEIDMLWTIVTKKKLYFQMGWISNDLILIIMHNVWIDINCSGNKSNESVFIFFMRIILDVTTSISIVYTLMRNLIKIILFRVRSLSSCCQDGKSTTLLSPHRITISRFFSVTLFLNMMEFSITRTKKKNKSCSEREMSHENETLEEAWVSFETSKNQINTVIFNVKFMRMQNVIVNKCLR